MNRLSVQHFDACIAELSRNAPQMAFASVPTGICAFWAESLGWPEWLREGTAFAGATKLPRRIMMVDDLRITANLIENVGEARLVEMIFEWRRFSGDTQVLAAPDLEAALRFLSGNVDRANPPLAIRLEQIGDAARLSVSIDDRIGPFANLYEQVVLAVMFLVVRSFVGLKDNGRGILGKVTIGTLQSSATMAQRVPCQVVQAKETPFMLIPRDALALPNPGFRQQIWDEIRGHHTRAPRPGEGSPLAVEAVESALASSLGEDRRVLQFPEVAHSLNRSERSLARDLAKAGLSYRALVDRVRMSMAQELLLNGGLSVIEVAGRLGYSDDSAFVRSFRRHFGLSPARWRRTAQAAPPGTRDFAA